jgi:hypothetical protein
VILELAKNVAAKLEERNCPIPVILDVPERGKRINFLPERIVIEHDDNDDAYGPVLSHHKNAKHAMTRNVAARARIYARSPKSSALPLEHKERCETILDMVLVALRECIVEQKKSPWLPKSGGFFIPEDLEGGDRLAGAAYELKFNIERGVPVLDWAGDAQPEATVGGVDGVAIVNTVRASLDGDDFEQVIP